MIDRFGSKSPECLFFGAWLLAVIVGGLVVNTREDMGIVARCAIWCSTVGFALALPLATGSLLTPSHLFFITAFV